VDKAIEICFSLCTLVSTLLNHNTTEILGYSENKNCSECHETSQITRLLPNLTRKQGLSARILNLHLSLKFAQCKEITDDPCSKYLENLNVFIYFDLSLLRTSLHVNSNALKISAAHSLKISAPNSLKISAAHSPLPIHSRYPLPILSIHLTVNALLMKFPANWLRVSLFATPNELPFQRQWLYSRGIRPSCSLRIATLAFIFVSYLLPIIAIAGENNQVIGQTSSTADSSS